MSLNKTERPRTRTSPVARSLPGLLVCFALGGASTLIAAPIPAVNGLVFAILLGILWRNFLPYPAVLWPGTKLAQKPILRLGIVLLGLQIPVGVIIGLGPWVIITLLATVGLTFWVTMAVGRWMKMSRNQRLLMASGFSICGAAAVAGTDSVTDSDEEEVATAIAMVVVYGTLMILLMPALATIFELSEEQAGLWIGLSTHEVAQVVAAGGIVGGSALAVAVTVKLSRVLLLAPVLAGIAWSERRRVESSPQPESGPKPKRPPLVPLFVLGFMVCVALGSIGVVPESISAIAQQLQVVLLSTAMFALGLSVHVPSLLRVGGRPAVLGATSTLFLIVFGGVAVMLPNMLGFEIM